jgi:alkanesulfonate monooxygenase SsuD/methylene tetrahydromethanopterin reductase-like flavin-dependent oxidoreductase (luciferase family)
VKVSIFCEHILPRPWTEDSEYNRLQQSLEQFELADKMGFHAVWMTEHHFLEEYCHSTAPEVFLAAVSQRTKKIRLGHGIVQLLPGINHPARVAERVAVLDLVSNGRVELGTGEGSSASELDGFCVNPGKKREMWIEGMKVAIGCMADEPFGGFSGEFVSMPPRNVVPKPRQKPHPPLWVACTRQETITMAGENGLGALSFSFAGPEKFAERVVQYYDALERCVPIGRYVNANILASAGQLMCGESDDRAMGMIENTGGFFGFGIAHYYIQGGHRPGVTNLWDMYETMLAEHPENVDTARMGGVGGVEKIRRYLRRFEDVGVDQLMFLLPPVPHERIMESLERFGQQVLPEFVERDAAATAAKAKKLEPVIERAMARRVDDRRPVDPEYEITGVPVSWDGLQVTEIVDTLAKIAAEQEAMKTAP